MAGRHVRGNESTGKKSLDSIRHPFWLFVTEHRSDEHQPNYTHRWLTVFCHTLKRVCFCGAWKRGFDRESRWFGSELSVYEQTERGWALGLVPFLCTSISIECVLSLRGFTWIQGCPNNWKQDLGANLWIQGRVRLILSWWSTRWCLQHVKAWRSKRQSSQLKDKRRSSLLTALTVLHHPRGDLYQIQVLLSVFQAWTYLQHKVSAPYLDHLWVFTTPPWSSSPFKSTQKALIENHSTLLTDGSIAPAQTITANSGLSFKCNCSLSAHIQSKHTQKHQYSASSSPHGWTHTWDDKAKKNMQQAQHRSPPLFLARLALFIISAHLCLGSARALLNKTSTCLQTQPVNPCSPSGVDSAYFF